MFLQNSFIQKVIFLTVMGFCSFSFTEETSVAEDGSQEETPERVEHFLLPELTLFGKDAYNIRERDYCADNSDIYCWYTVENAEQCPSGIAGVDLLKIIQSREQRFCLDIDRQTTSGKTCSWEDNSDSECWIPVEYEENCASIVLPRLSSLFDSHTICFKDVYYKIYDQSLESQYIEIWSEKPQYKGEIGDLELQYEGI